MKIVKKALLAIGLIIVLYLVLGFFSMFIPMTELIHASSAQDYAQQTGTTNLFFPASASNISYAWSSVGMGGRAHILKFNASIEDCKTFARQRFNHYAKQLYDNPTNFPAAEIVPLVGLPEDPRPRLRKDYGLKKLEWFDYQNMTNGLTLSQPISHIPTVWIDIDRSALYEYWTD